MKFEIKSLIVLVIVAMAFSIASASDTTTKFQTGPFTVSIDLGNPCNDLNISKPIQGERSGIKYTDYITTSACGVFTFLRYDTPVFDLNSNFGTTTIQNDLLSLGISKDTISVFEQKIDGKPGAIGSGYISGNNTMCSPEIISHWF